VQLAYHAYFFTDPDTGNRFRCDLREFLRGYAAWKNAAFKNQFSYAGESIFLLSHVDPVFLFVQARDREIIKKIARQPIGVSEMREALSQTESIGFASFIYVADDYFAIASTALAPRMSAFATHINQVFGQMGAPVRLGTQALTYSLPRDEAQRLSHVGAFSMVVQPGNRLRDSIVEAFGAGARDNFDVGSIEITIRPVTARANNRGPMLQALDVVGEEGLAAFDARGKFEIGDRMTDVYVVGAGGIRDPIDPNDHRSIVDQIVQAVGSNRALEAQLHEYRASIDITHVGNPGDLGLAWPSARSVELGTDPD
jgi:hypothetical protein